MLRRLIAFVVALIVMVVLGSIAHSLFVQAAWAEAAGMAEGAPATLAMSERIEWITHDLVGLQPLFGALSAIALTIAFLAAGLMARFTGLRTIVFAVAGAVAIFALFTILKLVLGTVGVFGARGMFGLGAQMTAGLIAGLVFATMTRPQQQ